MATLVLLPTSSIGTDQVSNNGNPVIDETTITLTNIQNMDEGYDNADSTAGVRINATGVQSGYGIVRLVPSGGSYPSDFSWANVTAINVRVRFRTVGRNDDTGDWGAMLGAVADPWAIGGGNYPVGGTYPVGGASAVASMNMVGSSAWTGVTTGNVSVSGLGTTFATNIPVFMFDLVNTNQTMSPDGHYGEIDTFDVVLTYTPAVAATWVSEDYRFYDESDIDAPTALAAENTNISRTVSNPFILVMNAGESANATTGNTGGFTLQHRVNGGGWVPVSDISGAARLVLSAANTDQQNFNNLLSAITGVATQQQTWNEFFETGAAGPASRTWTDDSAEYAFSLSLDSGTVSNGDTIEFSFLAPDGSTRVPASGYPTVTVGTGGQTITCTGIGSAEAHGSHTIANVAAQTITVTGIASAEAHGSHTIANVAAQTISPTGLASAEAIGSHTLTQPFQTITVTGIASAEAIGSHTIEIAFQPITCTGIASAEAHGATTIANVAAQTISPAGIASAEAIGAATIANVAAQTISPTGIASAEATGSHTIANVAAQSISTTGIASAEAIGSHTIGQAFQSVTVTGIVSAEAIGSHTITQPVQSITLTGIASAETHGSHTITQPFQTITLTGIASSEAIGSHTAANVAAQTISPTGLASAEAIGSHTVGQATQNITLLNGIDSANLFGTATIANATPQTISPASLVNSQVFGSTTISHNSAQSISVTGIASAEAVSNATIAHASPQTVTVTGIASVEQVGSHTVTGGGAPTWIGGWWVNGQQVDAAGPIGTIFLDDVTPVPGTAHFYRGIAFDPNGKRYICSWPGSGTVFYHNGIAHRSDGAMCVVQSSPDYYVGGFGVSYRGELCVALLTADLYNAGIGITTAGRTGVSAL